MRCLCPYLKMGHVTISFIYLSKRKKLHICQETWLMSEIVSFQAKYIKKKGQVYYICMYLVEFYINKSFLGVTNSQ